MKPEPDPIIKARAARAMAHAKLDEAARVLDRAKRIAATAADHVRTFELKLAQTESDQAAKLADMIAAGPSAERPTVIDESVVTQLAVARFDLQIKTKALKSLEATDAAAQAAVAVSEAGVIAAVDAIFASEDAELEQKVKHHLDQALHLGKQLFARAIDNEMNRHGELFHETLSRLDGPLLDRRFLAVNFMREGDPAESARRAARRASLISGLTDKEASAA
jgi:hypothetical protein